MQMANKGMDYCTGKAKMKDMVIYGIIRRFAFPKQAYAYPAGFISNSLMAPPRAARFLSTCGTKYH